MKYALAILGSLLFCLWLTSDNSAPARQVASVSSPRSVQEDRSGCLPRTVMGLRNAARNEFPQVAWHDRFGQYLGVENVDLPLTGGVESTATYAIVGPRQDCVEYAQLYVNINSPRDYAPAVAKLKVSIDSWFRNNGLTVPHGLVEAIDKGGDFEASTDGMVAHFSIEHFTDGPGVRQPDGSNYHGWTLSLKVLADTTVEAAPLN